MYTIYKITNSVNNKSYIGFTSRTIRERFNQHRSDTNLGSKYYIHNAMRKHGVDNFQIEIIETHEDLKYAQNVLEPRYIQEFNTLRPNGYNLTPGGEGTIGHEVSEKVRRVVSESTKRSWAKAEYRNARIAEMKTRNADPVYKKRLSDIRKTFKDRPGYTEKRTASLLKTLSNPTQKQKWSECRKISCNKPEFKEACSKRMKEIASDPEYKHNQIIAHCKHVYEVTFPDGRVEKTTNISRFCVDNDLLNTCMYAVINGKAKQHKGFIAKRLIQC